MMALPRLAGNRAVAGAIEVQRLKTAATSPLGGFLRDQSFGSTGERHAPSTKTPMIGPRSDITAKTPLNTQSTNGNSLLGWHYHGRTAAKPTVPLTMTGKLILFFSGSSGSAEEYAPDVARTYCERGAALVAFNYRGFGGSTNTSATAKARKKGSTPSERGLYEDGMAMWTAAAGLGLAPGKIFLHGYSLGGSVASHLAKELTEAGTPFGGLVLHSSIDNVKRAAEGQSTGVTKGIFGLGGWLAHRLVGKMSTRQNLRELAQAQQGQGRNTPIHFMGGDATDQLGLGTTGLDAYAGQLGFSHTTATTAPGGHALQSSHMMGSTPQLENMIGNPQVPNQAPQNQGPPPRRVPPNRPLPPVPNRPPPPVIMPDRPVPDQGAPPQVDGGVSQDVEEGESQTES